MLKVNVSFNSTKATAGLKNSIDQIVRSITTDLFDSIKKITPVRSGREQATIHRTFRRRLFETGP